MAENKKHLWFMSFMAAIAALAVGYYFFYALPNYNNDKLNFEKEKQANEDKISKDELEASKKKDQSETAKNIKNDCIKAAQDIYFDFKESMINGDPIFYPYETEDAFNKNERIILAISSFQSCFYQDPRNDKSEAMINISDNATLSYRIIAQHLKDVKKKNPEICNSYLMTQTATKYCNEQIDINSEDEKLFEGLFGL